ncbi:MAG: flagellar hook-associated protein FlgL [Gemmatimonadales bacterium]|nr:flagellar hook-associated protein FlgL [Gemmatimonadales bacterium]
MRVTQSMQQRQVNANLGRTLQVFTKAQQEASTGNRFDRVSEDPLNASRTLFANADQRAVDQYRRNISSGRARLDAEESVLGQVTEILDRAREVGTAQGSGTASAASRLAAAAEVSRMIDQVASLGNATLNGEYIFGGHASTTRPFDVSGSVITYAGDTGVREAEADDGYVIPVSTSGQELLIDTAVLQRLVEMRTALEANDDQGVRTALGELEPTFNAVQTLLTRNGARGRQLELAQARLAAREGSLDATIREARGADLAEAITRMTAAQNALEAAYGTTSRMLQLNLTDYLR